MTFFQDRFCSYKSGLQSPTGWKYILSTMYVERYFRKLLIKIHNSTTYNTVPLGCDALRDLEPFVQFKKR